MTRTFVGLCVATAFSLLTTLNAQSPTSSPTASAIAQSSAAATEVRATGCLAKDSTGAFVLNSPTVEAPAPAATGTSGTNAPAVTATIPAPIKSATAFKVEGTGLENHVGHKVEI